MAKTERLDVLVVERGLFSSREIARTKIMEGLVLVDGRTATKPGLAVRCDARIDISPLYAPMRFVSRGGLKLQKALDQFGIDVRDRVCLDIGASTGGFTDCLLQSGAAKVYAIDVGYGQLDWSLRNDSRVVVLERTNARNLSADQLYERKCDGAYDESSFSTLVVMDVSFISILKVMPAIKSVICRDSDVLALIKPQFEAGKDEVGKGGVVRSAEVHATVLSSVVSGMKELGFVCKAVTYSPIKGPKGNIEFLGHFTIKDSSTEAAVQLGEAELEAAVKEAHAALNSQPLEH